MPELPEVETVRRGLAATVVGRRIVGVEVGRARVARRTSPEAIVHGLTGARIESAERRGKYLLLPLDTGETAMIHLRMSGQVLVSPRRSPRPAHTHVAALLDDDREVRFVDPRTFGEVVVFDPLIADVHVPELGRLGPDPIADEFPVAELRHRLRRTSRSLKTVLLDQHVVAGIGNIYADEILHHARLRPDRPASSLDARAERRLHGSILAVLSAAVDAGGSTLRDAQYVDISGSGGSYQDEHRVYGRGGERCRTCGRGVVRRVVRAGRSTHFCAVCQR